MVKPESTNREAMPIRIMHPESRRILTANRSHLRHPSWKGWVEVGWDCVCKTVCTCHKRPVVPPPAAREQAERRIGELVAGVNRTREMQGLPPLELREVPREPEPKNDKRQGGR